jgi:DNA-binding MarR family transcriptional regulator
MICIREPITPTALAQEMGIAPTTLSDRLQELLALGHIRRSKNPDDGRSYLIRPTAAGRRAVGRAAPVTRRALEQVLRRLGRRPPWSRRSTSSFARSTPSWPSLRSAKTLLNARWG